MDASKITQLNQQRANIYINRAQQSQDASLITYQNLLQSSRYLPQTSTEPPPSTTANVPGCETCGGMSKQNILTNTTVSYPNPYMSAKGNQAQTFSSAYVTLKRGGDNYCGTPTINQITSPDQAYIELPRCFCNNVDFFEQSGIKDEFSAPPPLDSAHAYLNPYLPNPKPYIADTQKPPCISCSHYKVVIDGEVTNSNTLEPTCRSCHPRPIDPNWIP